eukprot:1159123-Pelagomonas_calceolata.AAC.2
MQQAVALHNPTFLPWITGTKNVTVVDGIYKESSAECSARKKAQPAFLSSPRSAAITQYCKQALHGIHLITWTQVHPACAPQDAIPSNPNAFELFGFDVLIDDHGCVWVLEVNSSPSFSLDTPLDRCVCVCARARALSVCGSSFTHTTIEDRRKALHCYLALHYIFDGDGHHPGTVNGPSRLQTWA